MELEPGFVADPYTVDVRSGGQVDVDALDIGSDCRGYATSEPDFRLVLSESSSMIRVFFVADDLGEDATLIISESGADWVCNDDSGGLDPMVEFEPAEDGAYDIWIGSFSDDEFIDGTLYITELDLDPSDF